MKRCAKTIGISEKSASNSTEMENDFHFIGMFRIKPSIEFLENDARII